MAAISLKRATHADLPMLLRKVGESHALAGIASTPIELEATRVPLVMRDDAEMH